MKALKTFRNVAVWLALVFVAAVLSELPLVKAAAAWIQERDWPLMLVTGGMGVLGFTLMMGGILKLLMDQDQSLSRPEIEDVERSVRLAAKPVAWRAASYRVWGRATGREGSEQFSFREMKQAWLNDAWRRETVWRRRFITAAGAALLAIGLFGIAFTLGPPPIKAILGAAILYACAMLIRGFWRA